MRRMDWDTQKPGNVSRRVWFSRGIDTYVHKHDNDGIYRDGRCRAPEEYPVLCVHVSHGSGGYNASAHKAARTHLPWLEVETPGNRAPGTTVSSLRATADR